MRRSAWTIGAAMLAALSLVVAACGSTSGDDPPKEQDSSDQPPAQAKTGGKLTVLWAGDIDYIDCGQTYYQAGYIICNATQRPLYSYKPDNGTDMVPDLATARLRSPRTARRSRSRSART